MEQVHDAPAFHPSAPPDELFDISTVVDPGYIISLIRKLIPLDVASNHNSCGARVDVGEDVNDERSNGNHVDANVGAEVPEMLEHQSNEMDISVSFDKSVSEGGEDGDMFSRTGGRNGLAGDDVWEECGCVLWDLAATRTHAELMVQNLILEVLRANLMVSQPARAMEICLGIIGNLACHEAPMRQIVSSNGLIEIIVDQLFLDDTRCLCEACRLLTLGLQCAESIRWVEAMRSERILCRIVWVVENTLNTQLLEKGVGLLLAIIEGQREVSCTLLPSLTKLGLPTLLVNLLEFEISRLTGERAPERYSVLDVILRAIEALSILDGYSQEVCSNMKLFQLVSDLVKLPEKIEVADSCVAAAVLIANILSDVPDAISGISQDLTIIQGLLEILPFASGDIEARNALWTVIAQLLVHVKEKETSPSDLHQYVLVLVSRSDLIEDDLLDRQFDDSGEESKSSRASGIKALSLALQRIVAILKQWTASKDCHDAMEEHSTDVDVGRLLDCCQKYIYKHHSTVLRQVLAKRVSLTPKRNKEIDYRTGEKVISPADVDCSRTSKL